MREATLSSNIRSFASKASSTALRRLNHPDGFSGSPSGTCNQDRRPVTAKRLSACVKVSGFPASDVPDNDLEEDPNISVAVVWLPTPSSGFEWPLTNTLSARSVPGTLTVTARRSNSNRTGSELSNNS